MADGTGVPGGGGVVRADLDMLASHAQGLQDVSELQGQLMYQLGQVMEGLASTLRGDQGGPACQAAGERLMHDGQQFTAKFADHSHMMTNNRVNYGHGDSDVAQNFHGLMGLHG
jgi:hypothetical protein